MQIELYYSSINIYGFNYSYFVDKVKPLKIYKMN